MLRDGSKTTSASWRAAAAAAGVRLHRRISNMSASPSFAALSSPRQNTQFIFEPSLSRRQSPTVCLALVHFGSGGKPFGLPSAGGWID